MVQQMGKVGKVISLVLTWVWSTWRTIFLARNKLQRNEDSEWRSACKCPEAMKAAEPALRPVARRPQELIHKPFVVSVKNRNVDQGRQRLRLEVATGYRDKDNCRL
jgi:hypothetical protein